MWHTVVRLLLMGLIFISQFASAHYPAMECVMVERLIKCEVGFSDGSKAVGKPVRLIDYDENVLAIKKADRFSRVTFDKPEGEFYIQFDSGHEFPVEMDYAEL